MKKTLLFFSLLMGLSLFTYAQTGSHPPANGNMALPSNGATTRYQMPNLPSSSCTFVAAAGNTGNIYYGGNLVTNESGSNVGIPLAPGIGWGPVTVTNLAAAFFSTDTDANVVLWTCN